MPPKLLLHFSGPDHPGITASLTRTLADHQLCILDIGQAVVHGTLALGILIELPQPGPPAAASTDAISHTPNPLQAALIHQAETLGLQTRFTPIEADPTPAPEHKTQFLVTLLGRAITAHQLAEITQLLARHRLNIDAIERLSSRLACPLPPESEPANPNACLELKLSTPDTLQPAIDEPLLRAGLLHAANTLDIDIAFQRESIFRRNRRLFAFDMDSTLIQGEVIDELARLAGVGPQVAAITAAAMRGELDFRQSFTQRVALLKGLPAERVYSLLDQIPLIPGAERLILTLKLLGYKTAILSGGFTFFAQHLQQRLGIDYIHANHLDIQNGLVTGHVTQPIIDGPGKASLLRRIAQQENISLEQVVAVGDGANDLPMLNLAGMGIAFHAKPLVRQSASHSLNQLGLDSLLYLIGVRDHDLKGF